MKLKGDLFRVISTAVKDNGFVSSVMLNPDHIIFKGHFPGHPVTPGVIQLQIIHELLEEHTGVKLKLIGISNCKFLKVLDPGIDSLFELDYMLKKNGDFINVKTIGTSGLNTVIKLESVYSFS